MGDCNAVEVRHRQLRRRFNQVENGNLTPDPSMINKYALDGTPLNSTPWLTSTRNVGNSTQYVTGARTEAVHTVTVAVGLKGCPVHLLP